MSTLSMTSNQAALHKEEDTKAIFGFWVYIMTDCVLFATLFATYSVLHLNTFGGPSGHDLFSLPYVLTETIVLLTSSYTCGLAMLALRRGDKQQVLLWFALTFVLGLSFLGMEISEFRHLVVEGNSWRRSGFLSGYFTLVGTHGLHIVIGLLWMVVILKKVLSKGLTRITIKRLTMLSMFWHFLDVIWIFIFTIVYLTGAI